MLNVFRAFDGDDPAQRCEVVTELAVPDQDCKRAAMCNSVKKRSRPIRIAIAHRHVQQKL
jgi:hypothetical protein